MTCKYLDSEGFCTFEGQNCPASCWYCSETNERFCKAVIDDPYRRPNPYKKEE